MPPHNARPRRQGKDEQSEGEGSPPPQPQQQRRQQQQQQAPASSDSQERVFHTREDYEDIFSMLLGDVPPTPPATTAASEPPLAPRKASRPATTRVARTLDFGSSTETGETNRGIKRTARRSTPKRAPKRGRFVDVRAPTDEEEEKSTPREWFEDDDGWKGLLPKRDPNNDDHDDPASCV